MKHSRKAAAGVYVLGLVVAVGLIIMLVLLARTKRTTLSPEGAVASSSEKEDESEAGSRRLGWDDSGYSQARSFMLPITDPWSLEHIRDCHAGMSARGLQVFEEQLLREKNAQNQLTILLSLASLYLYDGEFSKAAERLERARKLAAANLELTEWVPTIVFFQGVAALRRGETENCIECQCQGSCIFPIQLQAVHTRPRGSQQAIKHFTEYLGHYPKDLESRWLLNIAYMTLGDYPQKVPPEYLLPLEPFKSEFDIGRFVDIAPQLGVNKFDQAGGAIMDDFDNDGLLDLVETSMDPAMPMSYYRNKGDGTFEDCTKKAGLDKQLGGLYCVQTDYNNDGWLDIFVPRGAWGFNPALNTRGFVQRPSLLRNNKDGTFTDVGREAGLLPVASQAAAWADYDNDGWLDLFLGNEAGPCYLFHNKGDGTFEEVSEKAGVQLDIFCKAATWGDFDNDGFPDLYVSNLNGPCVLFHNNGDGTFSNVTSMLPVVIEHGFSCWFFDYDNDGWPDLFASCFDRNLDDLVRCMLGKPGRCEKSRLYHNLKGKGFEDVTEQAGLAQTFSTMGSNFADFDNDGFLDFYLGTGDPSPATLVPNRMFKNVQGRRFADITTSTGTGHLQKGHGVACGDWDRDGNIDMFSQLGGAIPVDQFRNALYQNPGQGNHWLTLKLVGVKSNRPAVGARIKVTTAGENPQTIQRTVTSGSSFGANTFEQTIGLAKAEKVESVEIYWPTSRTRQVFKDIPIDQAVEIKEFDKDYRPLKWKRIPVPKPGS